MEKIMATVEKALEDFIFKTKYARYIPELKRRENWNEAVDRVKKMHLKRYQHLSNEDKKEIEWAFSLVKEKKILPSMRAMQFGGKAMLAHEARGFNCLGIDTQFITSAGVKSFKDFHDGDSITVLTHTGSWKPAVVKYFGKDWLYPTTISRVKSNYTVLTTKDHTWFLKNGETTTNLKEKDLLLGGPSIFSDFQYENADIDEKLYWCYGYVYGDGTLVKKNGVYSHSMVRLCKNDQSYHARFAELGFSTSTPLSCGGDYFAYTGAYLKTPPNPEIDDPRLIRAFVRGYLDADGAKNRNPTKDKNPFTSIQSSDLEHINFIRKCFPIAGVYIISERELTGQQTNYGIRPYTIWFNIFSNPNNQINSKTPFTVSSIEEPIYDDVWCLEVEDDHSFILANGLVTGNCSVRFIDSLRACSEVGYLMLCGCGTGIGLTSRWLSKLPDLVVEQSDTVIHYIIDDTIEGWADSLEVLLQTYFVNNPFSGRKVVFDYSKIRRKGSPLKTGGGKAPGAKPLKLAHQRIRKVLERLLDHKITRIRPIHLYDILMHFADAVLSGGVRRTASSVVFEKSDLEMMNAKTLFQVINLKHHVDEDHTANCKFRIDDTSYDISFDLNKKDDKYHYDNLVKNGTVSWFKVEPQRARSNNSILLIKKGLKLKDFKEIFQKTKEFGEPGFVFANNEDVLFNPCFEIGFIPHINGECGVQFCNLTSINASKISSLYDFKEALIAQVIIGTLQASYTNFPYLNKTAKVLTEEEALLGCSITGFYENPDIFLKPENLKNMAELAVSINEEWAKKLGIKPAARICCIKPEGTGSLVIGVQAPGVHPAHSDMYFRRVQIDKSDNIYQYFKIYNDGVCEECVWNSNKTDDVITFPIKSKEGSIFKKNITALEHLDTIKMIQENWVIPSQKNNKKDCNNSVSCTVIVKDNEWEEVIEYLYKNREHFSAVSFIADDGDKTYAQAPFETVTKEQVELFNNLREKFVNPDYDQLIENYDDTSHATEASCAGGQCVTNI